MSVEFERKYWTNDGVPTEEIPVPAVLSAENMNRIEEGISNLAEHTKITNKFIQLSFCNMTLKDVWASVSVTNHGFDYNESPYSVIVPSGVNYVKASLFFYDGAGEDGDNSNTYRCRVNIKHNNLIAAKTYVQKGNSNTSPDSGGTSVIFSVKEGDTISLGLYETSETPNEVRLIVEELKVSEN